MSLLGIYFGSRFINVVELQNKKILRNIQIPLSSVLAQGDNEKIPTDIKLVALLKDEFRKHNIDTKEAVVALSGKDLLIRTFSMPVLPREEMASAISFEAKKYIPFKIEDVVSDFELRYDRASRRNLVVYVGIRKEALEKYLSVLKQLQLIPISLEYSAFSILRLLRLAGQRDKGLIGVVCVDDQEEEVSFSVLENGYPLFSRDFTLAADADRPVNSPEAAAGDISLKVEKLRTESRVSLDYYRRKFPAKEIKKAFLLSSYESRADIETVLRDIGLNCSYVNLSPIFKNQSIPSQISFYKAYACALFKTIKGPLKANLVEAKAKLKPSAISRLPAAGLLSGLRLDFRLILLGVVFCGLAYGYGQYQLKPLQARLEQLLAAHPQVTTISPDTAYEQLVQIGDKYGKKLAALDQMVNKQQYFTAVLNAIPRAAPKGLWLTDMTFRKISVDGGELNLSGLAYVSQDKVAGTNLINTFVDNLRQSAAFQGSLGNIQITSLDSVEKDKIPVTKFIVSCSAKVD